MNLHLEGKSIVITGGTEGIGKALAFAFLEEGAKVAVCGRSLEKRKALEQEAAEKGLEILCMEGDVGREADMDAFAAAAAERHGGIDVWVNNAGYVNRKCMLDYTMEEYDALMNTNLRAVFYCSRLAAGYMKEKRSGVILNASSWAALMPQADTAIYGVAKAGVSCMTRALAATLAPYGIRVNAYRPGVIATEINLKNAGAQSSKFTKNIAMDRMGTPEEMARVIVFLASDAASYVNGVDIEVSGGKFAVQDCQMSWDWMRQGEL